MNFTVQSTAAMQAFGQKLGALLMGGEMIELVGDVGAGKTTFTKGLAVGLGVDEDVQSPSFTINRMYNGRDNLCLAHYDFYRLHDAGIMAAELNETRNDPQTVTVIEWAEIVTDLLPADRLTITITPVSETARQLTLRGDGAHWQVLLEKLK